MRIATKDDLSAIVAIYNETIASRMVTADTEEVSVSDRIAWFESHDSQCPLFVYEEHNVILAWLSYKAFYGRPAYNGCKEVSIYITSSAQGRGLGKHLLSFAQTQALSLGFTTLLGFIFSHNFPSIKLFKSQGFELWGELPRVAKMDDQAYSLSILGKHLAEQETAQLNVR